MPFLQLWLSGLFLVLCIAEEEMARVLMEWRPSAEQPLAVGIFGGGVFNKGLLGDANGHGEVSCGAVTECQSHSEGKRGVR